MAEGFLDRIRSWGTAERRRHTRRPVTLRVDLRFQSPSEVVASTALDLSRGGAFVASDAEIPKGSRVVLMLAVADRGFRLAGTVVRVVTSEEPRGPGLGIEFEDDSLEDAEALMGLVAPPEP